MVICKSGMEKIPGMAGEYLLSGIQEMKKARIPKEILALSFTQKERFEFYTADFILFSPNIVLLCISLRFRHHCSICYG